MKSMLISNATIVDVEAGRCYPDQNIEIQNGHVHSVFSQVEREFEEIIDATGTFVCPGLIDGHVHLFLDGGSTPRISFLSSDERSRWQTAVANASRAVDAGITTVRDCGGPAELVFRLQRAIENGDVRGPRVLSAGSPLTRPKGHCHFFGIELTSPADAYKAVDYQARRGADFVKLIASGGGLTPDTSPAEADLPIEIMHAAVAAARANDMLVSAHCHAVDSIVRAIETRVDIIEHASFTTYAGPRFDPEIAARIKDQGTIVSPTVISGLRIAQHIRKTGPQNGLDHQAVERLEARRQHVSRFCEAGVQLLAGTDCGVVNTPSDSLVDELLEYASAGLCTVDALRSATCQGARYLRQTVLGQIKPGFVADLLLLAGDPLKNLEYLRRPLMVVRAGKIVAKGVFDADQIRDGSCRTGVPVERGGDGQRQTSNQAR